VLLSGPYRLAPGIEASVRVTDATAALPRSSAPTVLRLRRGSAG
jgi:hypothetical protein